MNRVFLSLIVVLAVVFAGASPALAGAKDSLLKNNLRVTGTFRADGAATFTTPITSANINAAVRDYEISIPLNGGALLADGVTYEIPVPMQTSGTVTGAYVSCGIRIAGGTNTLLLAKRNGGTEVTMLSTANVDPTAVPTAAFTGQALTLSATPANLAFVAGDCIIGRIVCGTMTTDGKGYTLNVRIRPNDQ